MRKITFLFVLMTIMSACLMSCSKNDDTSSVTIQREYPISGWDKQVMMGENGDIVQAYLIRGVAYLSYSGDEYQVVATTITGNLYLVNIKDVNNNVVSTGRVIISDDWSVSPLPVNQRLVLNGNNTFSSKSYQ